MKFKLFLTAFVLSIVFGFAGGGNAQTAPALIDFELEIELKDFSKYDIEYEAKQNTFEAKYQVPGSPTVYGEEAKVKIEPLLNELQMTPSSNKSSLMDQILSLYQINKNDIDDFDLEVKFDNGQKLEIEA